MKTRVEITGLQDDQTSASIGDQGYIDGYCSGGDGRPYAVVVLDSGFIELIMTPYLRAIELIGQTNIYS